MTDDLNPAEVTCLRAAIDLARRSRSRGNHPFGALLVDAVGVVAAEAENTVVSEHHVTGHAETNLVRIASRRFDRAYLRSCTMYTSTEPCAMCSGAIYWCGIGRVIYGLSEAGLLTLTGSHEDNPTMSLPCRDVFAHDQGPSGSSAQPWKTRPAAFMTGSGTEPAAGETRARTRASVITPGSSTNRSRSQVTAPAKMTSGPSPGAQPRTSIQVTASPRRARDPGSPPARLISSACPDRVDRRLVLLHARLAH